MKRIFISALVLLAFALPAEAAITVSQTGFDSYTHRNVGTVYTVTVGQAAQPFNVGSVDIMLQGTSSAQMLADVYFNGVYKTTAAFNYSSQPFGFNQVAHFDFATSTMVIPLGQTLRFDFYPSSAVDNNFYGSVSTTSGYTIESPTGFYPYIIVSTATSSNISFDASSVSAVGVRAYCGIVDISGCITNAFAWAFVPDEANIQKFRSLSFASSSPFGYVYEIQSIWVTDSSTTSAQTSVQADITPFVGTFIGSSSVKVNIVSAAEVHNTLGDTLWYFLQLLMKVVMWWGFMWYIWDKATNFV